MMMMMMGIRGGEWGRRYVVFWRLGRWGWGLGGEGEEKGWEGVRRGWRGWGEKEMGMGIGGKKDMGIGLRGNWLIMALARGNRSERSRRQKRCFRV